MTTPMVLVATWRDGLFVLAGEPLDQELRNQSVRALASDGGGGALAIVNGRSLHRRAPDGVWSAIATTELDLSCCVAVGDVVYVGTDDARVLRVGADGALEPLRGFDAVAGRETWYAGSAVINGQRVGPPLGIRSITATPDGAVLLANVHVGGIPRSTDGGATWQPTIDVESDVHEVRAHPNRPGVVMAAAAIGLCTNRDGGVTWDVEQEGLHASYCSAVAFAGDDVFVSASVDHFAAQGAIYRRRVDGHDSLVAVGGGLPEWTDGIIDTGCIATRGSAVALAEAFVAGVPTDLDIPSLDDLPRLAHLPAGAWPQSDVVVTLSPSSSPAEAVASGRPVRLAVRIQNIGAQDARYVHGTLVGGCGGRPSQQFDLMTSVAAGDTVTIERSIAPSGASICAGIVLWVHAPAGLGAGRRTAFGDAFPDDNAAFFVFGPARALAPP